jgi:Uma2 family endonuclease
MSTVRAPKKTPRFQRVTLPPEVIEVPAPPTNLPVEDGVPLESDWHRKEIGLLIDCVYCHRRGRTDFFAGGNMFIHFDAERARKRNFRGPDFFVVDGVDGSRIRDYWAIWLEEGRYPDAIIELTSPSTKKKDLGVKKDVYERTFRTKDYFCYDPKKRELLGWRLDDDLKYCPMLPDEHGRMECRSLRLWVGLWRGMHQNMETTWLRFFDAEGRMVPTSEERAEQEQQRAEQEKQGAEEEKQRAEQEKQRADMERKQAEAERKRADAEKQRADALEAELSRLKAKSAKKK